MFLQLKNITKRYPGVVALNDVSLDVIEGEVHALVGENGAGKSTLIKTCTGAITPNEGSVVIQGQEFTSLTPKVSEQMGVSVIYQEFNLVDELSVAENIFLGRAIRKGLVIDRKAMENKAAEIFKQFDIKIDPAELVGNLTVGYQQLVEIAKAVSQDAKMLIMDEPSAPLTQTEVEALYVMVEKLKAAGVTIVYISHRMDEIFRLSDRITVLRDGEKVKTMNTSDTNLDDLVTLMVGRELTATYPSRNKCISDEVLLKVENLSGNGVENINLEIRKGEVLGLAGLIGAGRTELAELLFGVKHKTGGRVILEGQEVNPSIPKDAIKDGIALVPEDRKKLGALLDVDIRGNISISILDRISKFFTIDQKEERRIADHYRDAIRIKTPNLEQKIKNLSGGNQQKVIIAKWLATEPSLVIFDEPTRGIDVGAKSEIYALVNSLVESGKAVLMISSEMEEVMGMSDRILVLHEGKITGELDRSEFNQEKIMSYASRN
ncbi:sugar ABC transporter ATP-binding protein [Verrucomicrobiaceae bacterium 5K15]|uniref:Sugar ABC transporter ATP-binding protein n=1 Tax=Oceaniferula flava TaxID=2800421 RepID=A0AAE2VDW3_9BACT|nr:sugar ABC transporter ATP-binding protein [Oceaniferula flavus]MBK1856406.1 sugar ABC transporter ATP-binding protein [Oceaniferula flavus]MBM1137713.1 sugar ABC transporter ATP-binding protein [Oceaniferula flavus]